MVHLSDFSWKDIRSHTETWRRWTFEEEIWTKSLTVTLKKSSNQLSVVTSAGQILRGSSTLLNLVLCCKSHKLGRWQKTRQLQGGGGRKGQTKAWWCWLEHARLWWRKDQAFLISGEFAETNSGDRHLWSENIGKETLPVMGFAKQAYCLTLVNLISRWLTLQFFPAWK